MANNLKMADAAVLAEASSLSVLLNAGLLQLWDGSQPATADATSGASVLGVTLVFANPAFAAASSTTTSATLTANAIAAVTAIASITTTWARFRTASSVSIMDGSVSTSGADINLNSVAISSGALVTISSVVHRIPK